MLIFQYNVFICEKQQNKQTNSVWLSSFSIWMAPEWRWFFPSLSYIYNLSLSLSLRLPLLLLVFITPSLFLYFFVCTGERTPTFCYLLKHQIIIAVCIHKMQAKKYTCVHILYNLHIENKAISSLVVLFNFVPLTVRCDAIAMYNRWTQYNNCTTCVLHTTCKEYKNQQNTNTNTSTD